MKKSMCIIVASLFVLAMTGCATVAPPPVAAYEEEQEMEAITPTEVAEVAVEEPEIEIPTPEEIANEKDENSSHDSVEHGGGIPVIPAVPLTAEVFAGQELRVSFSIKGFPELDFTLTPDDAARFLAQLDFSVLTETDDNSPFFTTNPARTRIVFRIGSPREGGFQASFNQEPDLGHFSGHNDEGAFTTFLIQPPGFFDSLYELVLEFEQYGVRIDF